MAVWKRWAWTKPETSKRVIEKNIGDCTRWVRPSCYDDVAPILPCDNRSRMPPPCDNDNCNTNNNGDGYGSVSNETEEGNDFYTSCFRKSTKIRDYGGDIAAYFHMDTSHASVNRKGLSIGLGSRGGGEIPQLMLMCFGPFDAVEHILEAPCCHRHVCTVCISAVAAMADARGSSHHKSYAPAPCYACTYLYTSGQVPHLTLLKRNKSSTSTTVFVCDLREGNPNPFASHTLGTASKYTYANMGYVAYLFAKMSTCSQLPLHEVAQWILILIWLNGTYGPFQCQKW